MSLHGFAGGQVAADQRAAMDLLRIGDRLLVQAVSNFTDQDSFTGKFTENLVGAFYHAGGELCCEALAHVREVALGARTLHELLTELDGIRAIAGRVRAADGYRPSAEAGADAQRVLNAILSDGIVHARGLRKGTKVRDELERLVAPGGPLVHGASPGVYCLAPEYGLALPGWQGQHSLISRE